MKLNYARNRIEKPTNELITVTPTTTFEDIRKQCQKAKNKQENIIGLYVVCDNFTDLSFLSRLTEMFAYLKDRGFGGECRIATYPNREYSKEEIKNLIKLDSTLAKHFPVPAEEEGLGNVVEKIHKRNFLYGRAPQKSSYKNVNFDTNGILWSIDEVTFFNGIIDEAVENAKNLSPLEKVAYFYTWVTDFQYKDFDDKNLDELAHTMYGLVSNGYAVCESMANIFELLCSRAGIKCIAVEKEARTEETYGHLTNAVYIEDPKYGVKGFYGLDPSNDALLKNEHNQNLSYFMFPLKYSERLYEGEYRDMLMDFSRPQNIFPTLENISRRGGFDFIPFKSKEMRRAVQAGLVEHRKLSRTKGLSKEQISENKRRQKKIERLCRDSIDYAQLLDSPALDPQMIENLMRRTLLSRLRQAGKTHGNQRIVSVLRNKFNRMTQMSQSIEVLTESIQEFILEDQEKEAARRKQKSKQKPGKGSGKGKKKKALMSRRGEESFASDKDFDENDGYAEETPEEYHRVNQTNRFQNTSEDEFEG